MQIDVIAENGGCYYGVLLVRVRKLGKRLIALGVDYGPLFNPADLVFLRLDLQKPPAVFQHFKLLPIHDLRHAIGDGSYAVVEVNLARGYINRIVLLLVESCAAAGHCDETENEQRLQRGPGVPEGWDERDGRLREHSQWRSS